MGYVQLLDLSIGFCKRLPFRVHEKIQRAMICTIWLLNIANWKIPTINGGFVRWENHLFQLGPFLPWRTGYVITRLGTWDVGIIHHIHPMGILVHFSMGLDGLAHPKKKGKRPKLWRLTWWDDFWWLAKIFWKKMIIYQYLPIRITGQTMTKLYGDVSHMDIRYVVLSDMRESRTGHAISYDILTYPYIYGRLYIYIHPLVI